MMLKWKQTILVYAPKTAQEFVDAMEKPIAMSALPIAKALALLKTNLVDKGKKEVKSCDFNPLKII